VHTEEGDAVPEIPADLSAAIEEIDEA
jgi:hypothetical protein